MSRSVFYRALVEVTIEESEYFEGGIVTDAQIHEPTLAEDVNEAREVAAEDIAIAETDPWCAPRWLGASPG